MHKGVLPCSRKWQRKCKLIAPGGACTGGVARRSTRRGAGRRQYPTVLSAPTQTSGRCSRTGRSRQTYSWSILQNELRACVRKQVEYPLGPGSPRGNGRSPGCRMASEMGCPLPAGGVARIGDE